VDEVDPLGQPVKSITAAIRPKGRQMRSSIVVILQVLKTSLSDAADFRFEERLTGVPNSP
jgi:hypothetical protein